MADFRVRDGHWICGKCFSDDVIETNVIPEAPMTLLRCDNCGWCGGVGKVILDEAIAKEEGK